MRNYTDFGGNLHAVNSLKEMQLFGGMGANSNFNKLKLKVEYDPFNYFDLSALNGPVALFSKRKESKSFGFNYPNNNFIDLEASYIKGNSLNLSFIVTMLLMITSLASVHDLKFKNKQ